MESHASSLPHGQKRQAEDDLEKDQRLTKRFNLLNLEKNGKLYISVKQTSPPLRRSRSNAFSDSMHLDDGKDRVYIHNLDEELAEIDSEEGKLVFLPDIEKRFTKVPDSVLAGQNPPAVGNEIILYSVPESLSIPREQDNVRKAIIESRERAREKQALGLRSTQMSGSAIINRQPDLLAHPVPVYHATCSEYDTDAMDLG